MLHANMYMKIIDLVMINRMLLHAEYNQLCVDIVY